MNKSLDEAIVTWTGYTADEVIVDQVARTATFKWRNGAESTMYDSKAVDVLISKSLDGSLHELFSPRKKRGILARFTI
jgi:hypothetical protein